ncbi:phosphate signaling complex protein PhoU [Levilactobacillus acidifarinae]|uniref:Phosphate-specific transport system accessory protein PhoU n=1 Tax=Levilactobacillus acidifarinae DSM 19394 = JCM 15949 TaxID=1423715 RepID=A0A0R1LKD6_9LACO|nr:phosphate signaling complex protein PhoU [Levilactobacillus acidifarinae]KRK96411.1 phosphate uptake regulator [Levilactobacillus acidifarinae DSM 19394]GEO69005.1 phosphate transport system regulatory protein PhoU [Levilactobacillus acidifarinae]
MRRLFDDELAELDADFTEMGMLVSEVIQKSVNAFIERDAVTAQSIIDHDHDINEREIALEKKTFEMIALYQPVTTDLREIVTILKAVSDLERAGDHARNIAHSTIKMGEKQKVAELEQLMAEMGQMTTKMVQDVLAAYVNKDDHEARSLADVDRQLDHLNHRVRSLSYHAMSRDATFETGASIYLNVAQDLSRIGDYVTNVCEWIIYLRSGKIVELNSASEGTED